MGYRLVDLSGAAFDLFPPGLEPAYVAVTTLGDGVVLTVALLALLWYDADGRRATAMTVAYAMAAYATVFALKAHFGDPRPPEALVGESGAGFPSGHSIAATTAYGGLALERGWLADRRRAAAVAALVAAVALSRVALRVHYLGDIVAGTALGVVVVLGVRALADGVLWRAFAVAAALAVPMLVVAGLSVEHLAVAALAVVGLAIARFDARVASVLPALVLRPREAFGGR
jgi:membrane-associated phospholipid phosphatase